MASPTLSSSFKSWIKPSATVSALKYQIRKLVFVVITSLICFICTRQIKKYLKIRASKQIMHNRVYRSLHSSPNGQLVLMLSYSHVLCPIGLGICLHACDVGTIKDNCYMARVNTKRDWLICCHVTLDEYNVSRWATSEKLLPAPSCYVQNI
jgi:hypothetical protein